MRARQPLKFRVLSDLYAIVRLAADTPITEWATTGEFTSITRTSEELSIVCQGDNVPKNLDSGARWICLKIEGPFAFSQTGVLLSFIEPLSDHGIPIFAVSTYDTDYVLVQEEFTETAKKALQGAGHEFIK